MNKILFVIAILLVSACNGGGGSGSGGSDNPASNGNGDNQNSIPVITGKSAISHPENATTIGQKWAVTDQNGADTFTVELEGVDKDAFTTSTAQNGSKEQTVTLTFKTAPDYENPTDKGKDNIYTVTLTASDGDSSVRQNITITVTDVNDNTPTITGASAISHPENATTITQWWTVSDQDTVGTLKTTLSGADKDAFSINTTTDGNTQTVTLTFNAAPDFESPADNNTDNTYDITLTASDGSNDVAHNITITITDVGNLTIAGESAINQQENVAIITQQWNIVTDETTDNTLTVTLKGDDKDAFSMTKDEDGDRAQTVTLTFNAAPDYENPTDTGKDNTYDITLTASDGTDSVTHNITITVTNVNDNSPTSTAPSTISLNVAENTTDTGHSWEIVDLDGADTLTVALTGDDSAFFTVTDTITDGSNTHTVVLAFNAPPDFENPTDSNADNTYNITLTASDGSNDITQSVTITITDVNESTPSITGASTASIAENTTAISGQWTITDEDTASTLTVGLIGDDSRLFTVTDTTTDGSNTHTVTLEFVAAPDYENPTDTGKDNTYDITLTASDGSNDITHDITITVTDVNENPTITGESNIEIAEQHTGSIGRWTVSDQDPENTITVDLTGDDSAFFTFTDVTTQTVTTVTLEFVAEPDFENPTDSDKNNIYTVTLTASDGTNSVAHDITITVIDITETLDTVNGTLYTSTPNAALVFLDSNENSLFDNNTADQTLAEKSSTLVYDNANTSSAVQTASFVINKPSPYSVVRYGFAAQIPLIDGQSTTDATNSYVLRTPYNNNSVINSLTTLVHHIAFSSHTPQFAGTVQQIINHSHRHLLTTLDLTTDGSLSVFADIPARDATGDATSDSDAHFLHAFMQTIEQIIKSNTGTLLDAANANNFTITNTADGARRRVVLNEMLLDAIYNKSETIANAVKSKIAEATGFDTRTTVDAIAIANGFIDITDTDSIDNTTDTEGEFYSRLRPYYAGELQQLSDMWWLNEPFYNISYDTNEAKYKARAYRINSSNGKLYYIDCDFITSVTRCINNFTRSINGKSGTSSLDYSLQDNANGRVLLVVDEDASGGNEYWNITTTAYQSYGDNTQPIRSLLKSYKGTDASNDVALHFGFKRYSIGIGSNPDSAADSTNDRIAFNRYAAVSIYQALGGDASIESNDPVMEPIASTYILPDDPKNPVPSRTTETNKCTIDGKERVYLTGVVDFRLSKAPDPTTNLPSPQPPDLWDNKAFFYDGTRQMCTFDLRKCAYTKEFTSTAEDGKIQSGCACAKLQENLYFLFSNETANFAYSNKTIQTQIVKADLSGEQKSIATIHYPQILGTTADTYIGNEEYALACPE